MGNLINLQKQSNIVSDPEKLSLGSLYLIGTSGEFFGGGGIAAMPVSIKQNTVSLYFIAAYEYHTLKSSNKSVAIFSFNKSKFLTTISKIFSIKISRETINALFNSFAEVDISTENVVIATIRGHNIEFIDCVEIVNKNEISSLKLRPIKRITNISEWPRLAIKKWAVHHLEIKDDSLNYIYGSSIVHNKKSLVDTLQKYNTYKANRNKQHKSESMIDEIRRLTTTTIIGVDNVTIGTNTYEWRNSFAYDEVDDIPF